MTLNVLQEYLSRLGSKFKCPREQAGREEQSQGDGGISGKMKP